MSADRNIRLLEPALEGNYDRFLCELSDSTLYYSSAYRRFLMDLLGCKAEYYLAVENGRIRGVLPLMMREGRYGCVINSLPFYGSNGGILAVSEWARTALVGIYNEIAQSPKVVAATIVSNPLYPDFNLGVRYDMTDDRIGQISGLEGITDCETSLLERIDSSARRNIKRAEREGVRVRASSDAITFLEQTHRENMREINGRPKSPAFFALIRNHFTEGRDYDIYVAEQEGRKLAALLVFYFNRTVEYFTPATALDAREIQPMALILRHAMLDAAARGFKQWNWGGTWLTQEGVHRFKKKWGAADRPYRYYVKADRSMLAGATKEDLLEAYPDFYVVPFARLDRPPLSSSPNE